MVLVVSGYSLCVLWHIHMDTNSFNTSHQVATCAMLVHFLVTVYVGMHQRHALLSVHQTLYSRMTLSVLDWYDVATMLKLL